MVQAVYIAYISSARNCSDISCFLATSVYFDR
ncbi:hypothetical protein F0726_02462 [Acidithiobacillus caldus]|nr:hypothetical protein F0726_02462 [Acidithiobacillus caldus]